MTNTSACFRLQEVKNVCLEQILSQSQYLLIIKNFLSDFSTSVVSYGKIENAIN